MKSRDTDKETPSGVRCAFLENNLPKSADIFDGNETLRICNDRGRNKKIVFKVYIKVNISK